MKKLFGSFLTVSLVALAFAVSAFAWHTNGVSVQAVCHHAGKVGFYKLSATVNQSKDFPGAFVKSVDPHAISGTSVFQVVTVVVGWPNSSETQTFSVTIRPPGTCV